MTGRPTSFAPPADACSSETAPTQIGPSSSPTERAPGDALAPNVASAPTGVSHPTAVGAPGGGAASPFAGLAHRVRGVVPETVRPAQAAVAIAVAVLVVLLGLAMNGNGSGGAAPTRSVTPVPAGADPAQTAHDYATWLRSLANGNGR
jgi:hypothetical protein